MKNAAGVKRASAPTVDRADVLNRLILTVTEFHLCFEAKEGLVVAAAVIRSHGQQVAVENGFSEDHIEVAHERHVPLVRLARRSEGGIVIVLAKARERSAEVALLLPAHGVLAVAVRREIDVAPVEIAKIVKRVIRDEAREVSGRNRGISRFVFSLSPGSASDKKCGNRQGRERDFHRDPLMV